MTTWYDRPRDWGTLKHFNLDHLLLAKRTLEASPEFPPAFSIDENWLMGHAIPPFQRGIVWDEERMIAFIETLAQKGDPGTWTYHTSDELQKTDEGKEYFVRDKWLLDGQQRITAIDRFFDDVFPVYGLYWSQIEETRRRGFLMSTIFPAYEVKNKSELELRELYDLKNFGGVPHQENERALTGFKP